ncbi:MAG: hypothetical protein AAFQ63_22340 [Cyanobacteria bacterium J06621_11]
MNISKAILWALPLSIMSSLGATALATRIEMRMLPRNGPGVGCPESLTAYETARPPAPGGYATDGMVQLSAIATNISATQLTDFTAVWTGTLKSEYSNCIATAGIYSKDGETFWGHSHLRVQLADGQAKVVLDMTGVRDANGFTSTIIEQTMREGNPRWTWGGTD